MFEALLLADKDVQDGCLQAPNWVNPPQLVPELLSTASNMLQVKPKPECQRTGSCQAYSATLCAGGYQTKAVCTSSCCSFSASACLHIASSCH